MKSFIIASVVAITAASAANAADIVRHQVPAAVNVSAFSWTGAYVGADVGARVSRFRGQHALFKKDVLVGGLYAGYNFDLNHHLFAGFETDFSWSGAKYPCDYTGVENDDDDLDAGLDGRIKERWSGTTRIRVGYSVGRFMPYVTAGVAYSRLRDVHPDLSQMKMFVGYAAGAGVEYALTDHIAVRGEYRYTDFGNKKITPDTLKSGYKTNDFRVGVAYRF